MGPALLIIMSSYYQDPAHPSIHRMHNIGSGKRVPRGFACPKVQVRSIHPQLLPSGKANEQVLAKLRKAYGEETFQICRMEKWALNVYAGQADLEDAAHSGRPPKRDISGAIIRSLDWICPPRSVMNLSHRLGVRSSARSWIPR
jgi:hypothetical protein